MEYFLPLLMNNPSTFDLELQLPDRDPVMLARRSALLEGRDVPPAHPSRATVEFFQDGTRLGWFRLHLICSPSGSYPGVHPRIGLDAPHEQGVAFENMLFDRGTTSRLSSILPPSAERTLRVSLHDRKLVDLHVIRNWGSLYASLVTKRDFEVPMDVRVTPLMVGPRDLSEPVESIQTVWLSSNDFFRYSNGRTKA